MYFGVGERREDVYRGRAFAPTRFALSHSALAFGGTWKDHAVLKIMPSPWPRMISAPENCFDLETGRSATPYSPGSKGDAGTMRNWPGAIFCVWMATRS